MPTRRVFDHFVNTDFKVEIEGVTEGVFKLVDGFGSFTDVLPFQDGDNILERKRPGRTHYPNIILRRGYTGSSELFEWRRLVTDGKVERKAGSIILLDATKKEILRFNFFEAWPNRWHISRLDADQGSLLFEEIELVIEKLERG